jgi:hypothetical protein
MLSVTSRSSTSEAFFTPDQGLSTESSFALNESKRSTAHDSAIRALNDDLYDVEEAAGGFDGGRAGGNNRCTASPGELRALLEANFQHDEHSAMEEGDMLAPHSPDMLRVERAPRSTASPSELRALMAEANEENLGADEDYHGYDLPGARVSRTTASPSELRALLAMEAEGSSTMMEGGDESDVCSTSMEPPEEKKRGRQPRTTASPSDLRQLLMSGTVADSSLADLNESLLDDKYRESPQLKRQRRDTVSPGALQDMLER